MSVAEGLVSFALSVGLLFIRYPSGMRFVQYSVLAFAALVVVRNLPRQRESLLRWALKIVGVLLNCYVGFMTVPALLRDLLPELLAFGLPAFLVTAALYCAAPVNPGTGREWTLWQWLLWAGWVAAVWVLWGRPS
jgi:amino acid transporter